MLFSKELNLLIAFSQSTSKGLELMKGSHVLDWQLLYELAIRHSLYHQLSENIKDVNLVPSEFKTKISTYCNKDKIKLLTTTGEIIRISRELKSSHIRHWFVKGILLAQIAYKSTNSRPCKDIDLWVDSKNLQNTIDTLIKLGYQLRRPNYMLTKAKLQYLLKHIRDFSLVHPRRQIEVELHFGANCHWLDYFKFDDLVSQEVYIGNESIITLQDDFHLLYLMIHGATHAWIRLRWLYDIKKYLETEQINLNQVFKLAKILNCEHVVFQALNLVNQVFDIKLPNTIPLINQVDKKRVKQLTDTALKFISEDYEFNQGIWHKMFFKYRIYLLRLAVTGTKFKTFKNDFIKLDQIFMEIDLPDKYFTLYYLLYPFWVIKSIFKPKK